MDKVTDYTGASWNIHAVETLQKQWREGVPAAMISQTLGRSEAEVRAKAAELGLPQHVGAPG